MWIQRPVYRIGIIITAAVVFLLQARHFYLLILAACDVTAFRYFHSGVYIGNSERFFVHMAFHEDRFVSYGYPPFSYGEFAHGMLQSFDPRTGETTKRLLTLSGIKSDDFSVITVNYGPRMWLEPQQYPRGVLVAADHSYEIVRGAAEHSTFVSPVSEPPAGRRLLLNGEPAFVEKSTGGFIVWVWNAGAWKHEFDVALPLADEPWAFGNVKVDFHHASDIMCFNANDLTHVFVLVEGRFLYRQGLVLRKPSTPTEPTDPAANRDRKSENEPVSALQVANAEADITKWTLVREAPVSGRFNSFPRPLPLGGGMMVDGQLAAIILDDDNHGAPLARLYRLVDGHWSEFASHPLPCGTIRYRCVTSGNGQTSYLVTSTALDRIYVFAIDQDGIRMGPAVPSRPSDIPSFVDRFISFLGFALLWGIILGYVAWESMANSTCNYRYGNQTVVLACLGRRGLARLIDLGLLASTSTCLAWILTRGFDWVALEEANNLHLKHSSIAMALQIVLILELWIAGFVVVGAAIQGRWGITFGKWCCGMRTLRTTLRPCGFSRSLVREIAVIVDACGLFCWIPGVLSIAYTQRCQRLGDLVADTIVVRVPGRTRATFPAGQSPFLKLNVVPQFENGFGIDVS